MTRAHPAGVVTTMTLGHYHPVRGGGGHLQEEPCLTVPACILGQRESGGIRRWRRGRRGTRVPEGRCRLARACRRGGEEEGEEEVVVVQEECMEVGV